jgi:hypothetical protein
MRVGHEFLPSQTSEPSAHWYIDPLHRIFLIVCELVHIFADFFAAGATAEARHEDLARRLLGHHINGADDKNPEFIRLALLLHPEFSSRGSASGIARAQPHP